MALIPFAGKDIDAETHTPSRPGQRREEVHSYLQGLAPVGEPFALDRRHAIKDLGFGTGQSFYRHIWTLEDMGIVARRYGGIFGRRGGYVVLKRLEQNRQCADA